MPLSIWKSGIISIRLSAPIWLDLSKISVTATRVISYDFSMFNFGSNLWKTLICWNSTFIRQFFNIKTLILSWASQTNYSQISRYLLIYFFDRTNTIKLKKNLSLVNIFVAEIITWKVWLFLFWSVSRNPLFSFDNNIKGSGLI